jgi:ankyrin repeat protein
VLGFIGWYAISYMTDISCTTVHWTALSGRVEIVDLLLEKGADIEAQTQDGKTVVHIAIFRGHFQYLKHIISKCADINASRPIGRSAVHFVVIGKFRKICQFLTQKKVDYHSIVAQKKSIFDIADNHPRTWAHDLLRKEENQDDSEPPVVVRSVEQSKKKRKGGGDSLKKSGKSSPKR